MKGIDLVILVVIGACFLFAIIATIKKKKSGKNCCNSCPYAKKCDKDCNNRQ